MFYFCPGTVQYVQYMLYGVHIEDERCYLTMPVAWPGLGGGGACPDI